MEIPKAILAIRHCTARDQGRYAINGVFVSRRNGKPIAVATNGRTLLWASWKDSTDKGSQRNFECILGAPQLQSIEKALKGKRHLRAYLDEAPNGTARISAYGTETTAETISGLFPKWQQVLPHETKCIEVTFDIEQLSELIKTLGTIAGKGAVTLRIPSRQKHLRRSGPILIVPANSDHQDVTGHKAVGVIMPLPKQEHCQ